MTAILNRHVWEGPPGKGTTEKTSSVSTCVGKKKSQS